MNHSIPTIILSSSNYSNSPSWGYHLILNLYNCAPDCINSHSTIEQFVLELCGLINMQRFGDPIITKFGGSPSVAGYSLVQLIDTSSITGHFVDATASAYLDVFSCKSFDIEIVVDFCINAYHAKSYAGIFMIRK